jgi:hypothetical protein
MAFDRLGAASPMIMVGAAVHDRLGLAYLAEPLAPHVTVLSYDLQGRGKGGDTQPYSVERPWAATPPRREACSTPP